MQYEFGSGSSSEYELFMRKVLRGVSAGYGDLSAAECGEIVAAAVPVFERYGKCGGAVGTGGSFSVFRRGKAEERFRLVESFGDGRECVGDDGIDAVAHDDGRQVDGDRGEDRSAGRILFVGDECGGGSARDREWEEGESVSGLKGKHWKKNQRKRKNRRGRINVDTGSGLGSCSGSFERLEMNADAGSRETVQNVEDFSEKRFKDPLRLSLERKWALENELKALRAEREIELLKSEDREAVKKLRERKVQGATERTMVQIEKAHASLVQTGNVPGVQPGFCQTVVDGEVVESVPGLSSGESKECSISPSSSISEREVRNMMKELEDLKEKVRKYERKEGLEERVGKMYAESVPITLDSEECVPEDVKELAADRFEGPEFFKYGKVFEKDNKKYRTMRFDAEGYSYSGRENWYG